MPFIKSAPRQLVNATFRPSERSKLPVKRMIAWPSAQMATVED